MIIKGVMPYNVTGFETVCLIDFSIPLNEFYERDEDYNIVHDGNCTTACSDLAKGYYYKGTIKDGNLIVKEMFYHGIGSGRNQDKFLELLSHSKGKLVAIVEWENGDTIEELRVLEGVISCESTTSSCGYETINQFEIMEIDDLVINRNLIFNTRLFRRKKEFENGIIKLWGYSYLIIGKMDGWKIVISKIKFDGGKNDWPELKEMLEQTQGAVSIISTWPHRNGVYRLTNVINGVIKETENKNKSFSISINSNTKAIKG